MLAAVIAWFRSLLFSIVFYGTSLIFVLLALLLLPLGRPAIVAIAMAWSRFHRLCAYWLLGQRVRIEGEMPEGAFFCVLKHEAMFETIDLLSIFHLPVIAAKRELLTIPLWGRAARAYGILSVDRAGGAAALRTLRVEARAAIDAGRPFCLFPEGTRVAHGKQPPLKSGFAGLYALLQVPVVPVAVDSGRLNRRGHFTRLPGVIRYRIGEPIPPSLPRKEVEARVHAAINALNS
ncbi:MAG TPA: lysophospholipid acyltransferase family protein [Sphingobium sp.]|nr:lysophospholipid acyltransferase family protein [Sphingobium sp.]